VDPRHHNVWSARSPHMCWLPRADSIVQSVNVPTRYEALVVGTRDSDDAHRHMTELRDRIRDRERTVCEV
jgi:hypothetical protein